MISTGEEFFLGVYVFPEKTIFEVTRKFKQPRWLLDSIYFMDHDSLGRCYCKWMKYRKDK